MSLFVVAVTCADNQGLLKKEVEVYYPDLKLSFSHKNFLSFKLDDERKLQQILRFRPAFARLWCQGGKILNTQNEIQAKFYYDREADSLITKSEGLGLIVGINEKQSMFIEDFSQREADLLLPEIAVEPSAPSRAYYKLAEAFKVTNNKIQKGETLLELGSSPGGATYYALKQGAKVIGVDPGVMDEIVFKEFPMTFKHLHIPVQKLDPYDLPSKTKYVAVDMNLNPHQSLKETLRVIGPLQEVKHLFFTLKIVKESHIELLEEFKNFVKNEGFKVEFFQLPTHRKECLLYGRKL